MKVSSAIPEYELVAPKEAVIAWKHNVVTTQIMEIIKAEIENNYRRVGRGETLGDNAIQDTARVVGYVEGLKFLTETITEVTEFIEDYDDTRK